MSAKAQLVEAVAAGLKMKPHSQCALQGGGAVTLLVTWRSASETIRYWFAPGIGITRYRYRHHGSGPRDDYKLVDFFVQP